MSIFSETLYDAEIAAKKGNFRKVEEILQKHLRKEHGPEKTISGLQNLIGAYRTALTACLNIAQGTGFDRSQFSQKKALVEEIAFAHKLLMELDVFVAEVGNELRKE